MNASYYHRNYFITTLTVTGFYVTLNRELTQMTQGPFNVAQNYSLAWPVFSAERNRLKMISARAKRTNSILKLDPIFARALISLIDNALREKGFGHARFY